MIAQLGQIEDVEVKSRLDELLEKVARGFTFTITKQNRPVAKLTVADDDLLEQRRQAMREIQELGRRYDFSGLDLKSLHKEGRK